MEKPLTFRQIKAVIMLASGDRVCDVAAKLAVTGETVRTWRRKRLFQEAFDGYMQKLLDSALSEAQAKMSKALNWLEEMHTAAQKDSDKIKAASLILNAAFRSHEITVLKKEFAKLRHLKDLVGQLMEGGGTTAPALAEIPIDANAEII